MDATGKPILAKPPPRTVIAACAMVLIVATATILTALAFEHLGGYAPCPLCLEERYAYYFAVPASALAL
ncbi:MAG: disulfide bond formation protein B, partial [Methyloceanibacter sp.]